MTSPSPLSRQHYEKGGPVTVSARDHSLGISPFLQAMLSQSADGPVYWLGKRLRWFTGQGSYQEIVLEPETVQRWCRHHGFPALLSSWSRYLAGQRFLVEHTSVNPVHPMHAGSLRGSVTGGFLVALLRSSGAQAKAHYFVNDLGRQARMLSWILRRAERHRLPPDLRFDHAAGVLYALVNMFHAQRVEDLTGLLARHPWLSEVIDLDADDRVHLQRWLASDQPPDAVHVRRMLDAALSDLTKVGASIDSIDYESDLPHAPDLPAELTQYTSIATINGTLCLRRADGFIPLTRPDGSWLYFLRDVLNTRRQLSEAPHVLHVVGSDQDLLQRALRDLLQPATVEHINFATVTHRGRPFSARQNRLMTLNDLDKTTLWKVLLPMLSRQRHTPLDLPSIQGEQLLTTLTHAATTAEAGEGINSKTDLASIHAWPLIATLLRVPEALRRALHERSPHPTAVLLHQASRLYLRAARSDQVAPWLREYFLHTQSFLTSLHGIPMRELINSENLQQELA